MSGYLYTSPKLHSIPNDHRYQTPLSVALYMCNLLLPYNHIVTVLEPTPGAGNILNFLKKQNYHITAPDHYDQLDPWLTFDAVVMNPPFIKGIEHQYLSDAMRMSPIIIALLPWFTLINSDRRTANILNFGLKGVTHLPRKAFPTIRVQTAIFHLEQKFTGSPYLCFFNPSLLKQKY